MTPYQKARALNALGKLAVQLDLNDNWYATIARVQVLDGGTLTSAVGRVDGHAGPLGAVVELWDQCAASNAVMVVNNDGEARKKFRWNGFMWQEVAE